MAGQTPTQLHETQSRRVETQSRRVEEELDKSAQILATDLKRILECVCVCFKK
ncbi:BnaC05g19920D [Brassica napus]|uniref:BnaC05g19920D protein n=1 Tax=Brassica napus TaxID=3708 RepID=A0A078FJY5_BRANA|nr:BnaC05g19920D [Brassica napus]